jgi:hypothetical protein
VVGAGVCVISPGTVAEGVKDGVAVNVPPVAGGVPVLVAPGSGVAEGVNPGSSVAVGCKGSMVEVDNGVMVTGGKDVPPGSPVPIGEDVARGSIVMKTSGVSVENGVRSIDDRVLKGT